MTLPSPNKFSFCEHPEICKLVFYSFPKISYKHLFRDAQGFPQISLSIFVISWRVKISLPSGLLLFLFFVRALLGPFWRPGSSAFVTTAVGSRI